MSQICILALVGLPAVGKTTFCHWLLSFPPIRRPFNVVHICYDDFLRITSTTTAEAPEDFPFKEQRSHILTLLDAILQSLKKTNSIPTHLLDKCKISIVSPQNSFLVICDDNNYYCSMRYKLYQFCRRNQVAYAQIYFDSNAELSLQRNALRPSSEQVPDEVLRQMCERLEPPNADKRPWECKTLTLNSSNFECSTDDIMAFIVKSFENIPKPLEMESYPKQPATTLHRIDLLLRQHIKNLLEMESTALAKQAKVVILNSKRKQILHQLKHQRQLPADVKEMEKLIDFLH